MKTYREFVSVLNEALNIPKTMEKEGPRIQAWLDKFDGGTSPEQLLQKIIDTDPTTETKYGMWILNKFIGKPNKQGQWKIEDLSKLTEPLSKFDKNKGRGDFPKDINSFKNLDGFIEQVSGMGDVESNRQTKKNMAKALVDSGEAELVFNNENYSIVIPRTHKASFYFAKGAAWCTANKSTSTYFDQYSRKGDLYIVSEKGGRKNRFQMYVENMSVREVKDYNNTAFSFSVWFEKHPEILTFFEDKGIEIPEVIDGAAILARLERDCDYDPVVDVINLELDEYTYPDVDVTLSAYDMFSIMKFDPQIIKIVNRYTPWDSAGWKPDPSEIATDEELGKLLTDHQGDDGQYRVAYYIGEFIEYFVGRLYFDSYNVYDIASMRLTLDTQGRHFVDWLWKNHGKSGITSLVESLTGDYHYEWGDSRGDKYIWDYITKTSDVMPPSYEEFVREIYDNASK